MKSNHELKEIDIKTRVCYYFDDIIILLNKRLYEIFQFISFRIKLQQVHGHCVLGLIK